MYAALLPPFQNKPTRPPARLLITFLSNLPHDSRYQPSLSAMHHSLHMMFIYAFCAVLTLKILFQWVLIKNVSSLSTQHTLIVRHHPACHWANKTYLLFLAVHVTNIQLVIASRSCSQCTCSFVRYCGPTLDSSAETFNARVVILINFCDATCIFMHYLYLLYSTELHA